MKTYAVRCIKCREGMYVNVPNAMFRNAIKQSEYICTKCAGGVPLKELYQLEALHNAD